MIELFKNFFVGIGIDVTDTATIIFMGFTFIITILLIKGR